MKQCAERRCDGYDNDNGNNNQLQPDKNGDEKRARKEKKINIDEMILGWMRGKQTGHRFLFIFISLPSLFWLLLLKRWRCEWRKMNTKWIQCPIMGNMVKSTHNRQNKKQTKTLLDGFSTSNKEKEVFGCTKNLNKSTSFHLRSKIFCVHINWQIWWNFSFRFYSFPCSLRISSTTFFTLPLVYSHCYYILPTVWHVWEITTRRVFTWLTK